MGVRGSPGQWKLDEGLSAAERKLTEWQLTTNFQFHERVVHWGRLPANDWMVEKLINSRPHHLTNPLSHLHRLRWKVLGLEATASQLPTCLKY